MRVVISLLLPTLSAAACGDDDTGAEPVALPSDADAVVLRLTSPTGNGGRAGGTSQLVVTAGGAVYRTGGEPVAGFASYAPPEPHLGDCTVSELSAAGLAQVFAAADALRLLAPPPEYADRPISDHANTSVELVTADDRYVHVAYALTVPSDESAGPRRRLAEFVDDVTDLEGLVGSELSAPSPFRPEAYSVWVDGPTDDSGSATEWPPDEALPEQGGCASVASSDLAGLDPSATTMDVRQGTTVYIVRLVPVLPVDEPCA